MIDKIITGYITSNRRLVVPEFGAFIRKDDNSVVFVPFLKKDDGVLKGLITDSLSVSTAEAAQMLDEYVLSIKQKLLNREGYTIEALGQLKSDANGIIYLDYNPVIKSQPTVSNVPQATPGQPHGTASQEQLATPDIHNTAAANNYSVQASAISHATHNEGNDRSGQPVNRQAADISEKTGGTIQPDSIRSNNAAAVKPATQPIIPPTAIRTTEETSAPAKAMKTAAPSQMSPTQAVRQTADRTAAAQKQPAKAGKPHNNVVKTDKFIAIAIIAAIIAIAAIVYGILANPTPEIEIVIDPSQNAVEVPADPAPSSASPAR